MEINSAIDITQNLIQNEQCFDSMKENPELQDSDFEEILAQESIPQDQLLKIPSETLPVTGNQLPLDLVTTPPDNVLIGDELQQLIPEMSEDDKKEENLPFVMTQLLMELPTKPLELYTTLNTEQGAKVLTLALNEPIPSLLEQASTPLTAGFALQPEMLLPENQEHDQNKELNLILKGSYPIDETSQAIKLSSDDVQKPSEMKPIIPHELQIALVENDVKMSEMTNMLFEGKTKLEIDPLSEQRTLPMMNEFYDTKGPIKQTMVLDANIQAEHFSDIFENKLMENVTLMLRRNENVMQIQIDPPELGKIDITIEQNDDKTDIRFMTQVDQTKQLIENSLDRLKLQLAQNGIELGQVDVNSGEREQSSEMMRQTRFNFDSKEEESMMATPTVVQNNQLLDLYI